MGYGGKMHELFDHVKLRDLLTDREEWILSYGDCDLVRELYEGHRMERLDWCAPMNARKNTEELVIYSKDLS